MIPFLKWFVMGAAVSTAGVALRIAITLMRVHRTSPEIGAVSFSVPWALIWILGGGLAVAIAATLIKIFVR